MNPGQACSLLVGALACDGRTALRLRSIAIKSAAGVYALKSTVFSLQNRLKNSLIKSPAAA